MYCYDQKAYKRNVMANTEKTKKRLNIRVRLDHKTIITIKDMAKFNFWKERYPKAVVME